MNVGLICMSIVGNIVILNKNKSDFNLGLPRYLFHTDSTRSGLRPYSDWVRVMKVIKLISTKYLYGWVEGAKQIKRAQIKSRYQSKRSQQTKRLNTRWEL